MTSVSSGDFSHTSCLFLSHLTLVIYEVTECTTASSSLPGPSITSSKDFCSCTVLVQNHCSSPMSDFSAKVFFSPVPGILNQTQVLTNHPGLSSHHLLLRQAAEHHPRQASAQLDVTDHSVFSNHEASYPQPSSTAVLVRLCLPFLPHIPRHSSS